MTRTFSLQCLGRPALYGADGRPVKFKTKKQLALVVYLAIEPRVPHNRDRLTELLWAKAPASEARHSLATALSVLRGKLGRDAFESGRDWIRLSMDGLELDLERLERGDVLATDLMPALDVGGFLEDFDIADAPAFAHWRDTQRARWQPCIGDALSRLMDRCRRTGAFAQIEDYANRMLRLDELNEDGIRAKMEARAFAGDRMTALRVFEQWKDRLTEELDAEPSPMLEGIAVRLRHRGLERQNTVEIAQVPTDQWKDRPFVGRAAEYRQLYEAWEDSRDRMPRHTLVLGDSGVGKSTLLHRLSTAAGLEGAAVSRAQGHALEQKVPYAALGTLVDELIERPGASCTEPKALAVLAQVVTRLRDLYPNLPEAPSLQGEAARIRLAESAERLVINVAEEQPVILIVDDLHHADDASIAVLHLLMRKLAGHPIMVLLAARIADLNDIPNGRRLAEAAERVCLSRLELGALSAVESELLIDSLIPEGEAHPTGTARHALLRAGAGFPMALELLVRDWQAHGDQCLALSLEAMTEDVGPAEVAADTYRQTFDRIRQQLDPVTTNVLHVASVLGARLHDPRMYRLADLSLGQMMTGLTQLSHMRVLRDSGRNLEFVNELIRGRAYLAIPSSLRRVLHARVADLLLTDAREGGDVPGLEIAWHLIRAGRAAEATEHLLRGARAAIRHGAPNEAERGLSSAMDKLTGAARNEGALLLAEAFQEQGKFRESVEALGHSLPGTTPDLQMRRVVLRTGAAWSTLGPALQGRRAQIGNLVAIASSEEPSIARARALRLAAGMTTPEMGDSLTTELFLLINQLERSATGPEEQANIATAKARLLYLNGERAFAKRTLSDALATLEEHKIESSIVHCLYSGRAAVMCADGCYEEALDDLLKAHEKTSQLGHPAHGIATNIALCHGRLGQYEDQAVWAKKVLERAGESVRIDVRLRATYNVAFSQAMSNKHEEAISTLTSGDHLAAEFGADEQWWALRKADILTLCGRVEEAGRSALNSIALTMKPASNAQAGSLARWLAYILIVAQPPRFPTGEARKTLASLQSFRLDRIDSIEVDGAIQAIQEIPSHPGRVSGITSLDGLPHATLLQLWRLWEPLSNVMPEKGSILQALEMRLQAREGTRKDRGVLQLG